MKQQKLILDSIHKLKMDNVEPGLKSTIEKMLETSSLGYNHDEFDDLKYKEDGNKLVISGGWRFPGEWSDFGEGDDEDIQDKVLNEYKKELEAISKGKLVLKELSDGEFVAEWTI